MALLIISKESSELTEAGNSSLVRGEFCVLRVRTQRVTRHSMLNKASADILCLPCKLRMVIVSSVSRAMKMGPAGLSCTSVFTCCRLIESAFGLNHQLKKKKKYLFWGF